MRIRGWVLVGLVAATLAVWALRLRYLAGRAEEAPTPEQQRRAHEVVRRVLTRMPVNVLERLLQELDQRPRRLDPYGYLPWDGLDVVVCTGEPPEARAFWRETLARVAAHGIRLVWIPTDPRAHALPELGLEFESGLGQLHEARPTHALPLLAEQGLFQLRNSGRLVRLSTPVVRLLTSDSGGVHAVLVPVGEGEVVILNAPEIAGLEDIRRDDNALLLAALTRRGGAARPEVGFLRAGETALEELLVPLRAEARQARRELRETPLLSLWSLVVANPSCLILLQLLLVALVHLLGAGRDLQGASPAASPADEGRFEDGLVDLYRRTQGGRQVLLAASSIVFRRRLHRHFGVDSDEALERALLQRRPEDAPRVAALIERLKRGLGTSEPLSQGEYLHLMESLEELLEEAES